MNNWNFLVYLTTGGVSLFLGILLATAIMSSKVKGGDLFQFSKEKQYRCFQELPILSLDDE